MDTIHCRSTHRNRNNEWDKKVYLSIFTARIRRMTGGYIFSLSTSQVWVEGVPHLRSRYGGVPQPRSRPGLDRVRPKLGTVYPLPQTWDGYPPPPRPGPPGPGTWYPTPWTWDGVPPPGPGTGLPAPPLDQVWIRQSSTASTCYAAGGVPLAFTQDFLVYEMFWVIN